MRPAVEESGKLFLNIDPETLERLGFDRYAVIKTADVTFSPEVRKMCEVNRCGKYNTTWACPPAIGTLEECTERCKKYENCAVFSRAYGLEDSFDFEGMMEGHRDFSETSAELRKLLKGDFLMLSVEGCSKCGKCTYPDAPCRFPETLSGSLEGYGIFVNKLAGAAGLPYNSGPNTVTYFGAVFF